MNTLGKPLLIGRKVFEEVGCKPLPGRRNIVLTSRSFDNVETFSSIDLALTELAGQEEVMIAGGGEIYRQMLPFVDKMLITLVDGSHEGDVFFPEYRNDIGEIWHEIERDEREGFSFLTYLRKSN